MKIMVVDDSLTMRRIVMMNLKKAGYEDITEVENGARAMEVLKSGGPHPDVVLLDWNMPELSGIDVLKLIKSDPALKSIPVIMITTEAEKERVLEAVQAGASGYLVKPLTPENFQKQVIDKLQKGGAAPFV